MLPGKKEFLSKVNEGLILSMTNCRNHVWWDNILHIIAFLLISVSSMTVSKSDLGDSFWISHTTLLHIIHIFTALVQYCIKHFKLEARAERETAIYERLSRIEAKLYDRDNISDFTEEVNNLLLELKTGNRIHRRHHREQVRETSSPKSDKFSKSPRLVDSPSSESSDDSVTLKRKHSDLIITPSFHD